MNWLANEVIRTALDVHRIEARPGKPKLWVLADLVGVTVPRLCHA